MKELPSARGLVVGAGSLEGVVRARASADDRISLRSHLSDDELATEYRRAQVVLMPSQFEGLGLVALEAMAAGAAVVGYDVVGLRDTIGDNGGLVPAGNVAELASVCRQLLQDDARREDVIGRAAIAVGARVFVGPVCGGVRRALWPGARPPVMGHEDPEEGMPTCATP